MPCQVRVPFNYKDDRLKISINIKNYFAVGMFYLVSFKWGYCTYIEKNGIATHRVEPNSIDQISPKLLNFFRKNIEILVTKKSPHLPLSGQYLPSFSSNCTANFYII